MGLDCGMLMIVGMLLVFVNVMLEGNIGVIGVFGIGIQELCLQIVLVGEGIIYVIGFGGCDFSCEVGGISVLMVLEMFSVDEKSEVLVFVLKLFVEVVCLKIVNVMKVIGKLMVVLFLGYILVVVCDENVWFVFLLDEVVCLVCLFLCVMV